MRLHVLAMAAACAVLPGCASLATTEHFTVQFAHEGVNYEVRYRYTPDNFIRWISLRPADGTIDPKDEAAGIKMTAAVVQFGSTQTCTAALLPKRDDVPKNAAWRFVPETLQYHTEKAWSDKPFFGSYGRCHPVK
jgi:hypothetical protein